MTWKWAVFWLASGIALQTLGEQEWLAPESCRTEIRQLSDGSHVYVMRCSPLEAFEKGLDITLQQLKRAEKFIDEQRPKQESRDDHSIRSAK